MDQAVSMQSVLEVFADFDQFGGASIELVAWELDVDHSSISGAWTRAISEGLLERSGSDRTAGHNEELWSLTDRGRDMQMRSHGTPRRHASMKIVRGRVRS